MTAIEEEELHGQLRQIMGDITGAEVRVSYPNGKSFITTDAEYAVQQVLSLIQSREAALTQQHEREYSWDSISGGWDGDDHKRTLLLIRNGKVVKSETLKDGKFCTCEPYRHGWPTLDCCVEKWAKDSIAELQQQPKGAVQNVPPPEQPSNGGEV